MRLSTWLLTGSSITLLALAPLSVARAQDATNPALVEAYKAFAADQSDANKQALDAACQAAGFASLEDCVKALQSPPKSEAAPPAPSSEAAPAPSSEAAPAPSSEAAPPPPPPSSEAPPPPPPPSSEEPPKPKAKPIAKPSEAPSSSSEEQAAPAASSARSCSLSARASCCVRLRLQLIHRHAYGRQSPSHQGAAPAGVYLSGSFHSGGCKRAYLRNGQPHRSKSPGKFCHL